MAVASVAEGLAVSVAWAVVSADEAWPLATVALVERLKGVAESVMVRHAIVLAIDFPAVRPTAVN